MRQGIENRGPEPLDFFLCVCLAFAHERIAALEGDGGKRRKRLQTDVSEMSGPDRQSANWSDS